MTNLINLTNGHQFIKTFPSNHFPVNAFAYINSSKFCSSKFHACTICQSFSLSNLYAIQYWLCYHALNFFKILCTTLAPRIHADVCPYMTKVVHNTCNMRTSVLPDMCTFVSLARGTRVHISGRTLVAMLQLLHI